MQPIYEGSTISWEVADDVIRIEGEGDMLFKVDEDTGAYIVPWAYEDFHYVEFAGNITSIGPEAFHTSDLVTVTIPDSVTRICALGFCKCQSLESVVFGRNVAVVEEYAFEDCILLKEAVLDDKVRSIGYHAFENCTSLERFVPSPVLEEIGENSFFGCTSLKTIKVPASVKTIVNNPFENCGSLSSIDVKKGNNAYSSVDGCLYNSSGTVLYAVPGDKKAVCFPEGVSAIGKGAFRGCKVVDVTIPGTVKVVGIAAFEDCTDLVSVTFERPGDGIPMSVLEGDVFKGCTSLETVVLREGVLSIGSGTFGGCRSLKSMDVPDTVTTIGWNAFGGCGLVSVKMPEELETIEGHAFEGCADLVTVVFDENLLEIGTKAFKDCMSLTTVDIPESVIEIGEGAFHGCQSLKKAIIHFDHDTDMFLPEHTEVEYPDEN